MLAIVGYHPTDGGEPIRVQMVAMVPKGGMDRLDPMGKMLGQRGKAVVMVVMVVGVEMVKAVTMERMPPVSAGTEAMVDTAPLVETDRMVAMVEMDLQEATQEMAPMVNVELMDQICISPSNQSILPFIQMKPRLHRSRLTIKLESEHRKLYLSSG